MSQPVVGADYVTCELVAATSAGATTLLVSTPTEPFPTLGASEYFYLTIVDEASYAIDANPPVQREIVKVTAYSTVSTGYSLTVVRGITTTAQIWAAGAICEIRPCEQWFEDLKSTSGSFWSITDGITTVTDVTSLFVNATGDATVEITDLGTGAAALTVGATSSGGGSLRGQEFTSSGTFNVPSTVSSVWVTMVGGGGGGAALDGAANGGGGGGSGEYRESVPVFCTPSGTLTVTIGAAGAGTTGPGSGTAGGTTSVSNGTLTYSAAGGGGANGTTRVGGVGGGINGAAGGGGTGGAGSLGTVESADGFGGASGGGGGNTTATAGGAGGANVGFPHSGCGRRGCVHASWWGQRGQQPFWSGRGGWSGWIKRDIPVVHGLRCGWRRCGRQGCSGQWRCGDQGLRPDSVGRMMGSQAQFFTSSGTFNVPSNVSLVYVSGVASGGGGGAGSTNPFNHESGSGGAGGESCQRRPLKVTPSSSLTITINSSGAGSISDVTYGGDGGDTIIGSFVLEGGNGGSSAEMFNVDQYSKGGGAKGYVPASNNKNTTGGVGGRESRSCWGGSGPGGSTSNAFVTGFSGGNSGTFAGGGGGVTDDFGGNANAGGAGGAATPYGSGGAGGHGLTEGGNAPAATSYGAGGGGAGGTGNSGPLRHGGAGISGCVLIEWIG